MPGAYAASYFFCNKTNQYVSLGDSLDQVQANCGAPASTTTKTIPNQKTQKAERWIYDYKPNSIPAEPQKNALVVTFVDNKATSIASSGQTPPCRSDVQLKKAIAQPCSINIANNPVKNKRSHYPTAPTKRKRSSLIQTDKMPRFN